MELFTKIINGSQLLDIFAKSSIVDAWLGSERAYEIVMLNLLKLYNKDKTTSNPYSGPIETNQVIFSPNQVTCL